MFTGEVPRSRPLEVDCGPPGRVRPLTPAWSWQPRAGFAGGAALGSRQAVAGFVERAAAAHACSLGSGGCGFKHLTKVDPTKHLMAPIADWLTKHLWLPSLALVTKATIRVSRLPRIQGLRILLCVPESEPYMTNLKHALDLLQTKDPESLVRARSCWFAISVRELSGPRTSRWDRMTRVLELSSIHVRGWHSLMLAGALAKAAVIHDLTLRAAEFKSLTPEERDELGENHATWFFSEFPLEDRHAANKSLDELRNPGAAT